MGLVNLHERPAGEKPIRQEFWSDESYRQTFSQLAQSEIKDPPDLSALDFFRRLDGNQEAIRGNYLEIARAADAKANLTPAAEWLLDNHHIIDENFRHLKRDMPKRFYAQLPLSESAPGRVPRTLVLAWHYVACSNSDLSLQTLREAVEGFQASAPLTIGEVWAIPAMLRFVLLENLRRLSDRVERARRRRSEANALADRIGSDVANGAQLLDAAADQLADDTFAVQLLYRLRDGNEDHVSSIADKLLATFDGTADAAIQREHARQSSGNVTTGNIVRSLRRIDDIDWLAFFESVSIVDRILAEAPDYAQLDKQTRNQYRTLIERTARRSPQSEEAVARMAAENAKEQDPHRHPLSRGGQRYLQEQAGYRRSLGEMLYVGLRRLGWIALFGPALFLSLLLTAVGLSVMPPDAPLWLLLVFGLVLLLPATDAAFGLFNFIALKLAPPRRLPAFDFSEGLPENVRTLVVIPALLTSHDTIDDLVLNLELHHLANPQTNILFALATDWPDSVTETSENDEELLDYARRSIALLSRKYAHSAPEKRFFLFHRRRLHNPQEGVWMGWERKRGKLSELNQLLRGDSDTTFVPDGDTPPDTIRYVLTLDADTRLDRGAVAQLAGKLAHPVNAPISDPRSGLVTGGHALLQPRVTASLTTGAEASIYQRTFSVNRGIDPYVFAVSDIYQDLFDEGSFTGKGLYDLDHFERATAGRLPENTVLSHDLLEGALARAALVTDVQFIEDFPVRYDVDMARQHRWARGDWQLLPFIVNPGNGLSGVSRLKMVDNLRRTLVPIAWVVASLLGWLMLDRPHAALWQTVLMASLLLTPIMNFNAALLPQQRDASLARHLVVLGGDFAALAAEAALRLTFMAHGATVMADAILRTLYRLFVSRRHLLEWKTAQQVHQAGSGSVAAAFAMMRPSVLLAVVAFAATLVFNRETALIAAPFLVLWGGAPIAAWYVSRSAETEDRLELSDTHRAELRRLARETWRYFETFAREEDHFLPPDNFQEDPKAKLARRTSPTNIGLYLLSLLSARDFGWMSFQHTIGAIERTINSVERLEKYQGHLFNWYDTETLDALHPRYVSAVDSGNLAGHLITLASALRSWAENPSVHALEDMQGIGDTFGVLRDKFAMLPPSRRVVRPLRSRLDQRLAGFAQSYEQYLNEPHQAAVRSINLTVIAEDIRRLARDLHTETDKRETGEIVWWADALKRNCYGLTEDATIDRPGAEHKARLAALSERIRKLAFDMRFDCLFDPERKLLSIGFRPDEGERDRSCYDLLASEARLASFFAIAKGDLPNEHWYHLGRPVVPLGVSGALLSWSGSMFEYLMPPLIMHEPVGSTLNLSNSAAVQTQIREGRRRGLPWGVSESAFNARDRDMNYQYHAFGIAALGLKRDLADDLVVAPYASILAAQFRPAEAVANLRRLSQNGARGIYGFYDAIDYTPQRLLEGQEFAVVRNYMAHHHGMSIVAIANAVFEGIHRQRFHADPVVKAAELLLQEKAPREIVPVTRPPERPAKGGQSAEFAEPPSSFVADPISSPREIAVLSNGRYSALISSLGTGVGRFEDLAVTRWRADPTLDTYGSHIFLRDVESQVWWSATPWLTRVGEQAHATLHDHKAEFVKKAEGLETVLECIVCHEADAEGRRLTIRNRSDQDRFIEVTSYGEIVLEKADADLAHPAFSKMFVETDVILPDGVILARRKQRNVDDQPIYFAHLFSDSVNVAGLEAETDRRAFIGRGRDISDPQAMDQGCELGGSDGFTLDPIYALRRTIRVPAFKSATLTMWNIVNRDAKARDQAVAHYRRGEMFEHELRLSWTYSQIQLRHQGISVEDANLFRSFASLLVYPDSRLAAGDATVRDAAGRQSLLWGQGISGDAPIFALRIDDEADLPVARKAAMLVHYLRQRGVSVDLALVNERRSSYVQDLNDALNAIAEQAAQRDGGVRQVFVVRRDLLGDAGWQALLAAARIVLHARNGKLSEQISRLPSQDADLAPSDDVPVAVDGAAAVAIAGSDFDAPAAQQESLDTAAGEATSATAGPGDMTHADAAELSFFNGYGGFAKSGREYVVQLRHGERTPQPWINVVARGEFGFHTSAEGASYSWALNSRDFQITPWSNDPVSNRPGETIHVVDLGTGRVATPYAALSSDPDSRYEARFGMGYCDFRSTTDWLSLQAVQTLAEDENSKLIELTLRNPTAAPLQLRVFGYVELVLGNNRARNATHVQVRPSPDGRGLLARNPFSNDFGDTEISFSLDRPARLLTASRGAFIGRNGTMRLPAALAGGALPAIEDSGGDPCMALGCDIALAAGAETRLLLKLSALPHDDREGGAAERAVTAGTSAVNRGLAAAKSEWDALLGTLQVATPDEKLDLMVNTWLPYQSIACRIRARSAFYQASGAYGFRDQLQDTSALLLQDPGLARAQILNAAGRQFPEGDFQHWWLPRSGAGVRTMISDDVVWLPHMVARYLRFTGDQALLDEAIPFIEGRELAEGEHDAFYQPDVSATSVSLFEHCVRALNLAIARTGPNGLPLILGGDWNDGMNRVGEEGRGESVWLGWFLGDTLQSFIEMTGDHLDAGLKKRWQLHREQLAAALETAGWDGQWYRRGTFDDGAPLGSSESDECQIDSIAQSWSVISGMAPPERAQQAMDSLMARLADRQHGLIKLFTPPFENTPRNPGYIKGYPPGVRENGGQYTHAASWVVYALARMGRGDAAHAAFDMINPISHSLDRNAADHYRTEPYVVAADIYGEGVRAGRGGWTWYTGSAGWLYRAAVEGILGLTLCEGKWLEVRPALPEAWPGYSADLQLGGRQRHLDVQRDGANLSITLDGEAPDAEGRFRI
ncbi:GH36-type glycosyl hydrolase domain-containing protein [Pseudohoeflea coraliihabitans]|uniref:Protein ndvB n=1 Tax=Pseudohoeflea coraliihabitans TaxID=2860393 RepID=A0ABS6WN66_9HYPH|nr:glucoamylase family protein [Pseudohoeflea sp. DP4N28-3]MBW3097401.1 protein ndvB [Pseudohoeflea sp. DP4N28-3]